MIERKSYSNPLRYFEENSLEEALVLRFSPDLPHSVLLDIYAVIRLTKLTSNHPDYGTREARRIIFKRISEYKRVATWGRFADFEEYQITEHGGTIAIYGVTVTPERDEYRFEATLASFGDVSFTFALAECEHRILKASRQNADEECEYVDAQTGELVDFYRPFGREDHSS